ncbi:hypothetical protein D3C71_19470 [compost metagenome]
MTTPYMPDSARAAMPQSCLQPLPPYLREDFAQSLDRDRPHELVPTMVRGKPVDPKRLGSLQYRYLDTGATTTVPNIWYNQTVEMRKEHWRFELRIRLEQVQALRERLELAKACTTHFFEGVPRDKAIREMTWGLQDQERLLATVQAAHDEVHAETRFC